MRDRSEIRSEVSWQPRRQPGKPTSKATRPAKAGAKTEPASRLIDQRIRDLGGWRGETLVRMRALILEADPEMTEGCKWIKPTNPLGVPVWSHAGIVCTGEAYTKVVKLTFARGASIPDPSRLFNSSLEGNTRRAIDIHEGEKVDAGAFKALVKAAVTANAGTTAKGPSKAGAKAKPGASEVKPFKARKPEKVATKATRERRPGCSRPPRCVAGFPKSPSVILDHACVPDGNGVRRGVLVGVQSRAADVTASVPPLSFERVGCLD